MWLRTDESFDSHPIEVSHLTHLWIQMCRYGDRKLTHYFVWYWVNRLTYIMLMSHVTQNSWVIWLTSNWSESFDSSSDPDVSLWRQKVDSLFRVILSQWTHKPHPTESYDSEEMSHETHLRILMCHYGDKPKLSQLSRLTQQIFSV